MDFWILFYPSLTHYLQYVERRRIASHLEIIESDVSARQRDKRKIDNNTHRACEKLVNESILTFLAAHHNALRQQCTYSCHCDLFNGIYLCFSFAFFYYCRCLHTVFFVFNQSLLWFYFDFLVPFLILRIEAVSREISHCWMHTRKKR